MHTVRGTARKSRHACIVEANESTGTRTGATQPRDHEDLTAAKGFNSLSHYNLVYKPVPKPQAMNIADAKAAVHKEWEKLEKIAGMASDEGQEQERGHGKGGRTVHFATLMD